MNQRERRDTEWVEGVGGDVVDRDTDGSANADVEQRLPLSDSTIDDPEPMSEIDYAPEGIESIGEFSRDAAEPADAFVDDLPDDVADDLPD